MPTPEPVHPIPHGISLEVTLRFWEKVHAPSPGDCWEWTAGRTGTGYGAFKFNGRGEQAHRLSYELAVGPIPDGLFIDHLCRVRSCVNPAHLEPVTMAENFRRAPGRVYAGTHCGNGHEFTEANTYRPPRGGRECRACGRMREHKYRAKGRCRADA